MIAAQKAVRDVVAGLLPAGRAAIGDGTGLQVPYCVIWGDAGNPNPDRSPGCVGTRSAVRVTCTAANGEAALTLAAAVNAALAPGYLPRKLTVPGFSAEIVHVDSRPVEIDRSVTLTGTNTHPAYVVLLFDVHATPTQGA